MSSFGRTARLRGVLGRGLRCGSGGCRAIGGKGGLVAVDAQGNVALPFNTEGMYRGYARVGEKPVTAIYR